MTGLRLKMEDEPAGRLGDLSQTLPDQIGQNQTEADQIHQQSKSDQIQPNRTSSDRIRVRPSLTESGGIRRLDSVRVASGREGTLF